MDIEVLNVKKINRDKNNKKLIIKKIFKILFCFNLILIFITSFFLYKIFLFLLKFYKFDVYYIDKNILEKVKLAKIITNNNELNNKGILNCLNKDPDIQQCIYHLITPKHVVGKNKILIGAKRDGGYVLLDDFKNIKIAYSFGIKNNIHFDKALADKGIDVYMYDHTIDHLPFNNSKFHWKKIGISGIQFENENLKTLEHIIIENGHSLEKNMILKMDVEHFEWYTIYDLKDDILKQFKYIAIEFHFKSKINESESKLYYNVLKKLQKTHQSFYFRCNGSRSWVVTFGNNRICKILEVSYILKEGNTFIKDESIYPIYEFDYLKPNSNEYEINLNLFKLFDN